MITLGATPDTVKFARTGSPRRAGFMSVQALVALYWRWVAVRRRLETVLGEQSRLPAPLASHAVDHVGALNVRAARILRKEYGVSSEPSAEDLLPLLEIDDAPSS